MAGARGEITLNAGDREVRLLYTNRALAEAEAAMGRSVIGVSQGFASGESGVTELAHLLQAGMEAARRDAREGGRRISINEAYEVLDETGFRGAAAAVFSAIGEVLSYDGDEERPNP
jgi:hypothetical protein